MPHYPSITTPVNHVQPVPRRVRGFVAGVPVFDTLDARYVWEIPPFPQYYIPLRAMAEGVLVDEGRTDETGRGIARVHALRVGDDVRSAAALVFDESPVEGVAGTVRFRWSAMDSWLEEDEPIFVHPRNPYARVDAVRSTRRVVVSVDGLEVARSDAPVMVFETGLPTRYYLNRSDVRLDLLEPSSTQTSCPYKGTTSAYWSVTVNGQQYRDVAWCYDFPTLEVAPIAGLVAFYNERADIVVEDA